MDPLEPVLGQRHAREDRRRRRRRVDRARTCRGGSPGSVSSSVRTAPPGASAASSTRTERPASASRIAAASPLGPLPMTIASSRHPASRSASWCSMLSRATSPWPQNACWASWPADAVGAVEVPRHRVPGPGGPDPRLALVRVEQQAVVPVAHEVALVGGQVEADQRRRALGHARAARPRRSAPGPSSSVVEPRRAARRVVGRDQRRDRHVAAREDRAARSRCRRRPRSRTSARAGRRRAAA